MRNLFIYDWAFTLEYHYIQILSTDCKVGTTFYSKATVPQKSTVLEIAVIGMVTL